VVYCGVTHPYSIVSHLVEVDDSSKSHGNFHAFGGYTRRGRDITRIGTGVVAIGQSDNAIAIYGKDQSHV